MKKIYKYTECNYNNVLDLEELPKCIKDATDQEIEATSPFKGCSSI
jgi:hypothetical protein